MRNCGLVVKIIYGLDKGKIGTVTDKRTIYGSKEVRVWFRDEHADIWVPEWSLEYC